MLNLSCVRRPVSMCVVNSIISGGSLLFFMLCASQSVTAFGNTPSMSRNSIDATFLLRHAFLTVVSNRCSESVVVWPGRPLKWVLGSSSCFSIRFDTCSAMIAVSSLHVVLINAMGQYAFGIE